MTFARQEPAARFRTGAADLAVLSDGVFYLDAGAVMGVVPRSVWEPVIGSPDERNLVALGLNSLLIRSMGKTILVDTGVGTKLNALQRTRFYPGDYGYLLGGMKSLGIAPEAVDAVVNSHLHFDHCGWNTVQLHGRILPTFPNARYYVARGELDAALSPNERTRASYLADNIAPLLESGQIEPVTGEHQITPEVTIVPAPGHTPDHVGVVIASGGETALFVGDLVQHAAQLERTAWVSAFDILPLVSMATKKQLLEQAQREGWLLVSPHASFPGAGRLVEREGKRRFVAAEPSSP